MPTIIHFNGVSMQERRDFLKTTAITASLLAVSALPQSAVSADMKFKNIIYTQDDPGRWPGKRQPMSSSYHNWFEGCRSHETPDV